jgi:hypothetical protein
MTMNRTGWLLIAFFGGIGLALTVAGLIAGGQVAPILASIGVIWFLVAGGLVLYHRQQGRKAVHERWLFENGIRGTATVLGKSSNTTINDQPVVKLDLEIHMPGQAPRRMKKRILMPGFVAYRMQPGVVLPVHVNPDPRKPGDLLVRW